MKSFFILLSTLLLMACSSNSNDNPQCNYLLDIGVNFEIDLSLPEYSQLNFAGNSLYIPNQGNAGLIVATTGSAFYAWDAADPNHALSACSVIEPKGLFGGCGCDDDNTYDFITGRPQQNDGLRCALRNYRIERAGNILIIFN
ncbi:hypothetical protein [Algibacter mikhailovii]|nr:hypothetical protein [Algibacter mikhailovii]